MREAELDLYRVLGVPRDADAADITRAYRRQARAWHPDVAPQVSGAAARFRAVAEAYQVLGDPACRAEYDRARHDHTPHDHARRGHAAPGPARPGPAASPHLAPAPVLWASPVRVDPPPGTAVDAPEPWPGERATAGWVALVYWDPGDRRGWPW
jgi:curved DNA-binding protein